MCVLTMLKNGENNGTEEIRLITPTPDSLYSHVVTSIRPNNWNIRG